MSWYQYTTASDHAAIRVLQRQVLEKAAAQEDFAADALRQMRDAHVATLRAALDAPLEAR